eukprot:TRINITY_DN1323_c0_g1_i1.p1 TRINITY_DN1323_c0_g1~~TRINITY_DN1323_c0_g1_i1.p1  ORF type:complete len:777 (+),score=163.52 TRINITY_DN1323_c0_g1_i1:719-3049(+)
MDELHKLIDKWERRLVDTAAETIDEKIESLLKQEERLRGIQSKMLSFIEEYGGSRYIVDTNWDLDEIETSRSQSLESTEDEEIEEILTLLQLFKSVKAPLKPDGVKAGEKLDVDVEEFSVLLDEAKRSLKRSLSFIGGIVRGYLRRGQKNDKWVEMIRKLEARYETADNADISIGEISLVERPSRMTVNIRHHQVWKIISDIYKYRDNNSLQEELCNQLYEEYESNGNEVDFYLPQLINMILNYKSFTGLLRFVLLKCRENTTFALHCFMIVTSYSTAVEGSRIWKRRCKKLLRQIELSVPDEDDIDKPVPENFLEMIKKEYTRLRKEQKEEKKAMESSADSHDIVSGSSPQNRAEKDYFFAQVHFMNALTNIAHELTLIFDQDDKLKPELDRLVKEMDVYLDNGRAYLPFKSATRHKVVRINSDESSIIKTYGRVLCWLEMEVVPVPVNLPKEVAEELFSPINHQEQEDEDLNATEEDPEEEGKNQPVSIFGEDVKVRNQRLRNMSPFGRISGWSTRKFIAKDNDVLLQEQYVMQFIQQFQKIFEEEGLPLKLRHYTIMALKDDAGLIEVIPNSISLANLKSKHPDFSTLLNFFKSNWPNEKEFEVARRNFIQSCAAYSIFCYFMQIKDRHNGNIMLASDGSLVHIDWGYLLSRTIKFEKAPFKLTEEYIQVMGGVESEGFKDYVRYCIEGFWAVRQNYEQILMLLEMSLISPPMGEQIVPCFSDDVVGALRKRFKLGRKESYIKNFVIELICEANDNWRTTIYDTYQRILNDIF